MSKMGAPSDISSCVNKKQTIKCRALAASTVALVCRMLLRSRQTAWSQFASHGNPSLAINSDSVGNRHSSFRRCTHTTTTNKIQEPKACPIFVSYSSSTAEAFSFLAFFSFFTFFSPFSESFLASSCFTAAAALAC